MGNATGRGYTYMVLLYQLGYSNRAGSPQPLNPPLIGRIPRAAHTHSPARRRRHCTLGAVPALAGIIRARIFTLAALLVGGACSAPSASSAAMSNERKIGVLVVGIGGNNGVTMVAGQLAAQKSLEYECYMGRTPATLGGCITQLNSKGVHGGVGFADRYPLAKFTSCALGGWDIRPKPLGDALYESRVLEYDLVRQVRDEMNAWTIMPGVWDKDFIGDSQHESATHAVAGLEGMSRRARVEHLRGDIRRFIQSNGVDGHTTVIWSASVERPCESEYQTADELLAAVDDDAAGEVSPSLLYAVAAALEGCSFVNGGSQNTLQPGLVELFGRHGGYALGTDFKAGQTKFKTCAVEYIRALGLTPRVIASSNHLGNNDMLNLTNRRTLKAKMRVKKDIFAAWQETELDHKVCVMYTPFIGDEKRDVVEYTSQGFLGAPHTMLTYTRCMDSILCVPLMVDSAVFCDYFAERGVAATDVSRALAYFFKIPEGGAKGCDPGFFAQMAELDGLLRRTQGARAREQDGDDLGAALAWAVSSGVIDADARDKIVAHSTAKRQRTH